MYVLRGDKSHKCSWQKRDQRGVPFFETRSFCCRGDSSSANHSLHQYEARLSRNSSTSSDNDNDSATDSELVSRKSSMESMMSNDSMMSDLDSERKLSETSSTTSTEGNNNSLPKEISYDELELLKKLEEQNR